MSFSFITICLISLLLFIWGFFIEPELIVVKKYKADINKKIVFVSDFHIAFYDKYRLRRIINLINKQNPDLVLSGGDFIKGHSGTISMDIESIAKELAKINAPVITVLGNHDCKFDKYRVKKTLEKYGITVLINSGVNIDNLFVAGVDEHKTGTPDVHTALENTGSPRILISHAPDIYYEIEETVDLILAGHVHGGQVRLPYGKALIVPTKLGTKFACGDFHETQNRMIVTKGLGTSLMHVRFCALPEIVVIEG